MRTHRSPSSRWLGPNQTLLFQQLVTQKVFQPITAQIEGEGGASLGRLKESLAA